MGSAKGAGVGSSKHDELVTAAAVVVVVVVVVAVDSGEGKRRRGWQWARTVTYDEKRARSKQSRVPFQTRPDPAPFLSQIYLDMVNFPESRPQYNNFKQN